jgi:hypothetical protein
MDQKIEAKKVINKFISLFISLNESQREALLDVIKVMSANIDMSALPVQTTSGYHDKFNEVRKYKGGKNLEDICKEIDESTIEEEESKRVHGDDQCRCRRS